MECNWAIILEISILVNILVGPKILVVVYILLCCLSVLRYQKIVLYIQAVLKLQVLRILIVNFLKLPLSRFFIEINLH